MPVDSDVSPTHRSPMRLETSRLFLRDFELEDAGPTLYWHLDPEVMRFIGGVSQTDEAGFRRFLEPVVEKYTRYRERGLIWTAAVVFERASWRPVGLGLLKPVPAPDGSDLEEIEIGWHLARHVWGRGYATEMGRALIDVAFEQTDLDRLNAMVDPKNEKSAAVCRRLGMKDAPPLETKYGLTHRFVVERS
ncbi:MAG: GNAT family N-acetyltransferase [Sandaracinus sp.]|nr:GNAT family N-acetyltransferase [Sandaracinus sp.]